MSIEINELNEDSTKKIKKAQITIHKFKSCNSTTSSVSADSTSTSSAFVSPNAKSSSLQLDLLPSNVKLELDQLELELLEGDITQKGYDKKRAKLLEPYLALITKKESPTHSPTNKTNIIIVNKQANELTKSKDKIRIPKKNKNRDDPNANRYHSGNFENFRPLSAIFCLFDCHHNFDVT